MQRTLTAPFSRLHYGWIVMIMGTLVVFGALGLARFGYTVLLPAMQVSLNMDNTQAGMLATANLIGYLALSVIGGAVAARYGPRAAISIGLILAGIGMTFTGMVNSFAPTLVWRTLSGIGSGASNVAVMGLMAAWFTSRRRGLASGIVVSGSSVALIALGPLAPRILDTYGDSGWRVSWYLFGGTTMLLALLAWLLLRNHPDEKGLAPLGGRAAETTPPHASAQGIQWGRVYRSAPVWHLGLVYSAFGFAYIIYTTFFTKYLITEAGYTQAAAGSLFMTMGWFSLLCGLIWGTVSDVIGRKRTLVIIYLFHALAFALFAWWLAPVGLILSAVLFGLTAWSIPAIMAASCGDVLGSRLAPAALGFITLFFGIGQAVGPSVAGAMADAMGSFSPAFLLASGISLLGAVAASRLRPASTVGIN
jgi:sugar phosphate permease